MYEIAWMGHPGLRFGSVRTYPGRSSWSCLDCLDFQVLGGGKRTSMTEHEGWKEILKRLKVPLLGICLGPVVPKKHRDESDGALGALFLAPTSQLGGTNKKARKKEDH